MLYRIQIDLAFEDQDPVDDILDKCLDHFDDAVTLNPNTQYVERGYIKVHNCFHDEDPNRLCPLADEYHTP